MTCRYDFNLVRYQIYRLVYMSNDLDFFPWRDRLDQWASSALPSSMPYFILLFSLPCLRWQIICRQYYCQTDDQEWTSARFDKSKLLVLHKVGLSQARCVEHGQRRTFLIKEYGKQCFGLAVWFGHLFGWPLRLGSGKWL